MNSCIKHNVGFHITYDFTNALSLPQFNYVEMAKNDFKELIDKYDILDHPNYIRQDNKPVIMLWSFMGVDGAFPIDQGAQVAKHFHDLGFYVLCGVHLNWRSRPEIKEFTEKMLPYVDLIQPWAVGSYKDVHGAIAYYMTTVKDDINWVKAKGKDYQTVVFPGFSWYNLKVGKQGWSGVERNLIPRHGGRFLWEQFRWCDFIRTRPYVAMFDEYDESTAIMKAASTQADVPKNHKFMDLSYDGLTCSEDYYLRLVGAASRMMNANSRIPGYVPIMPVSNEKAPTPASQETSFDSKELRRLEQFDRVFKALYNRPIRPDDYNKYYNEFKRDIQHTINRMIRDNEAASAWGTITNTDMKKRVIEHVMQRQPTPKELSDVMTSSYIISLLQGDDYKNRVRFVK